jgi:hypothetical protein
VLAVEPQYGPLPTTSVNFTTSDPQLQALYDAQRATSGEMERSLKEVLARAGEAAGEVEGLREAARRGEELQVQAVELKDTVMQQEGEIRALKAEAVRSGRDERRLVRLERAVAAYGRVEAAFAARTGQGFFGVNGLAWDLGLDLRGDAAAGGGAAAVAQAAMATPAAASEGLRVAEPQQLGPHQRPRPLHVVVPAAPAVVCVALIVAVVIVIISNINIITT